MERDIFQIKKEEFKNFILENQKLPKVWEKSFTNGGDLRLWFDDLCKVSKFKDDVDEIKMILERFNLKVLNDKEKEIEFLTFISDNSRIPRANEIYFSDNHDMYSWYISYKKRNKDFETIVHNQLKEYEEFRIEEIWPRVKKEFIYIIKKIKRIPNHGEIIIQDGIDVRVIYDKLTTLDPEFTEQLLLYLKNLKDNSLSIDDRKKELLDKIQELGYIPYLQESRFSDGTDMFTWYARYKEKITTLDEEIKNLITKENTNKKVNIYLIPNFKSKGGNFYTVCTNIGEKLDLSNISSFEEAKQLDETFTKRGGVILKKDEEINSVSFTKGNKR